MGDVAWSMHGTWLGARHGVFVHPNVELAVHLGVAWCAHGEQVSTYALTSVMWAIGASNTFGSEYPTTMKARLVNLLSVPVFANTFQLADSLTLNWNVVGSRLDFQAVLQQLAWYGSVIV